MISEVKGNALHILKGNWMKVVSLVFITYLLISLAGADYSTLSFNRGGLSFSPLTFTSSLNIVGIILGSLIGSILFFALVDLIHSIKHHKDKKYLTSFFYGFRHRTLITKGFFILVVNRILQLAVAICTGSALFNLLLMNNPLRAGVLFIIALMTGWLYLGISQCLYIFYDDPKVNVIKCISSSITLMKGRKLQLLGLYISFIGWFLLGLLAFIVGILWSIAYFKVSRFEFYESIKE
ncbi:DUF975 family protein [Guptibacillus hwajinpoensis]|uniref:Membrane protein n=1 Tax=Guptibacillus hwajinpoensis TaxID=208199 RepID=A0ABU0K3K3_9BACL|nr:DUF975 family protein [Alkalihalobacillus hemicentroti]MDQ0483945.1 putative membrane protein [Alkalihalobacillus hemicentroti]